MGLIAILLGTNVLAPFVQAGLGGAVPTALAASGASSAKGTPNTLQAYLAQAASGTLPPAANPLPPAGPTPATGKPSNQMPVTHGTVLTSPIEVTLDSRFT
jgi:hypothetical protein